MNGFIKADMVKPNYYPAFLLCRFLVVKSGYQRLQRQRKQQCLITAWTEDTVSPAQLCSLLCNRWPVLQARAEQKWPPNPIRHPPPPSSLKLCGGVTVSSPLGHPYLQSWELKASMIDVSLQWKLSPDPSSWPPLPPSAFLLPSFPLSPLPYPLPFSPVFLPSLLPAPLLSLALPVPPSILSSSPLSHVPSIASLWLWTLNQM